MEWGMSVLLLCWRRWLLGEGKGIFCRVGGGMGLLVVCRLGFGIGWGGVQGVDRVLGMGDLRVLPSFY